MMKQKVENHLPRARMFFLVLFVQRAEEGLHKDIKKSNKQRGVTDFLL